MIDIRKYLEDNHIKPPNSMSKDMFIKAILNLFHTPMRQQMTK